MKRPAPILTGTARLKYQKSILWRCSFEFVDYGLFAFYVSTVLFQTEQPTEIQVTQSNGDPTVTSAPIFRSPKFEINLNETGVHPAYSFRTEVALSPNGENLAFGSYTEDGADVWIKDLLTLEEPHKLTNLRRGGPLAARFSPATVNESTSQKLQIYSE